MDTQKRVKTRSQMVEVRAGRRVGPESERQADGGAGELNEGISDQRGFDV